jgi:hypothetical protein
MRHAKLHILGESSRRIPILRFDIPIKRVRFVYERVRDSRNEPHPLHTRTHTHTRAHAHARTHFRERVGYSRRALLSPRAPPLEPANRTPSAGRRVAPGHRGHGRTDYNNFQTWTVGY